MQRINDRMKEEITMLIISLQEHLDRAKENKKKYLNEIQTTEGIYDDDQGK